MQPRPVHLAVQFTPSRKRAHDGTGIARDIRPRAAPGRHRRRPDVVDRPDAPRRGRDGWLVPRSAPACSRATRHVRARPASASGSTRRAATAPWPRCCAPSDSAPDGIDAVAIMTPNDTHYEYAAAALDAGLDVICDKPVTHTFAQACDLAARVQGQASAVRNRARLQRLSDDAPRAPPGAQRRHRCAAPGAGGVHPVRAGHTRWSAGR